MWPDCGHQFTETQFSITQKYLSSRWVENLLTWLGIYPGHSLKGSRCQGGAKKNLSQPFVIRSSTSRKPYHQFCIEYVHCQENSIGQRAKKHGSREEENFCTSGIFFVRMMKILFLIILPSPGKYQVIYIPIPHTIGQLVLTLPW